MWVRRHWLKVGALAIGIAISLTIQPGILILQSLRQHLDILQQNKIIFLLFNEQSIESVAIEESPRNRPGVIKC